MWPNFDGKPYSKSELAAHINALDFAHWRGNHPHPKFIVLHNTSSPDIKLWLSWSPEKRRQYVSNVQGYYQNDLGWSGGPHFFVPPDEGICAFGFNDPLRWGVHASCFNLDSIGIEMVGEFNVEQFDSGPGAIVRDNAVELLALLHNKLGLVPSPYSYGEYGLHFHIECRRDNHDCPGRYVHKPDVIARVNARMAALLGAPAPKPAAAPKPQPTPAPTPAPAPTPEAKTFLHTNITATLFNDEMGAYGPINLDGQGVALPWRFAGHRPMVKLSANGRSVTVPIVDEGPWNWTDKDYVLGEALPRCVYQHIHGEHADDGMVPSNIAGIDCLPKTAAFLGTGGMGKLDWQFVEPVSAPVSAPFAATHDLKWVQSALNAYGLRPLLDADGVMGELTQGAIGRFQKAVGLDDDGIAGPLTIAALEARVGKNVKP